MAPMRLPAAAQSRGAVCHCAHDTVRRARTLSFSAGRTSRTALYLGDEPGIAVDGRRSERANRLQVLVLDRIDYDAARRWRRSLAVLCAAPVCRRLLDPARRMGLHRSCPEGQFLLQVA